MGAAGVKKSRNGDRRFLAIERDEFVADRRPRPSKPESERQMAYRTSIIASPVSFIYIYKRRDFSLIRCFENRNARVFERSHARKLNNFERFEFLLKNSLPPIQNIYFFKIIFSKVKKIQAFKNIPIFFFFDPNPYYRNSFNYLTHTSSTS